MNSILKTRAIIFGMKDYADLMQHYLRTDSRYSVVAFTTNELFMEGLCEYSGLPIIPFEKIQNVSPPCNNVLFVPLRDNSFRRRTYELAKNFGYEMPGYISSKALVNGSVGDNCFIQEFNNIQPFAKIGNNCVLWAGNHIGHHSVIEDDVTITSHCVISGHCKIGRGSYLGVNCTIRDGVNIGEGATIGMGAVVTKDVPAGSTVIGNPAKQKDV